MTLILGAGQTVWHNGLGSEMILIADGNGNLSGTYESQVGAADGPMPLCGKYNPDEIYPSLGWVVQWKKINGKLPEKCKGWTTTAWSAQLIKDSNPTKIKATWTLTKQTEAADSWKDTLVGCGEFTLVTPDE
jgi:hypothetical protein